MDSPRKEELKAVFEAIQVATEISRQVLGTFAQKDDSERHVLKADASPVTIADLAIQAVLLTVLSNCFPDYGLVAEESADQLRAHPQLLSAVQSLAVSHARQNPFVWAHGGSNLSSPISLTDILDRAAGLTSNGAASPTFWVIDPIDGTAAFLRGEQYAINVALVSSNTEVLSVIACPLLSVPTALDPSVPLTDNTPTPSTTGGSLLFSVRDHGAFIRPLPSSPAFDFTSPVTPLPIIPSTITKHLSCTATTVSSGLPALHAQIAETLKATHPHCDLTSWVLRWVALALQKATFTVWIYEKKKRYAKIWDHAGAMMLFEEVGGKVTDVNEKEIDLAAGDGRVFSENRGFVGASRGEHERVLGVVKEAMEGEGI